MDAFTNQLIGSNSVISCHLYYWSENEILQKSSEARNRAEAPFLVPMYKYGFQLRWLPLNWKWIYAIICPKCPHARSWIS